MNEPIYVTKSFVPSKSRVGHYMKGIWEDGIFANRGPRVQEFERRFQESFNIESPLLLVNNGTIALMLALRLLPRGTEVITTPFSYIATASSIAWQGLTPVFVDICPDSLNINVGNIEAAIGPKTKAIRATHVYGNPCDVIGLAELAKKHGLLLFFDAAHSVGVRVMGKSIFDFGDVSTTSFHATKVIHCGEGGGVFTKDAGLRNQIFKFHNFGHISPTDFDSIGINGKIPELSAALGLAVLDSASAIFNARKKVHQCYKQHLDLNMCTMPVWDEAAERNYAYFPVVFKTESQREAIGTKLQNHGIYPRRYFYPSLNSLAFLNPCHCPVSDSVASRVLCLPMYAGLTIASVRKICSIVNSLKL